MKIFPATALIPFLWLVPDTETRSSDDAPAREKAASPEKGEVVPWRALHRICIPRLQGEGGSLPVPHPGTALSGGHGLRSEWGPSV